MVAAGPWIAAWVRFAFAVPFTFAVLMALLLYRGHYGIALSQYFWLNVLAGSLFQFLASAAFLLSMRFSKFAIGVALQHSSIIVTAAFGVWFLGDKLVWISWTGLIIATLGMVMISWPEKKLNANFDVKSALLSGLFGFTSGVFFAICSNQFRAAVNAVEGNPTFFASTLTVLITQISQAIILGAILFVVQREGMRIAIVRWRDSLKAGAGGSSASIAWFLALGLAPAALVKAVNLVVEIPLSVIMGAQKFKEKLGATKILALFMVVIGVLVAVLTPYLA
ncbi:MAG: hypothetical protein FD163_1886 [Hyphomonadaceae bacterium]|nr:MAG: hypothetical protein FD128_1476 [Hyphomonadaceae bacterium]KAF0184312.1 MAG: hypothetical protein FD163_1886 [Hyphomonadaceae bacterium]